MRYGGNEFIIFLRINCQIGTFNAIYTRACLEELRGWTICLPLSCTTALWKR